MSAPASAGPGLALLRRAGALLLRLPRGAGWALVVAWMAFEAWLSSLPPSDLPAPPFAAYTSNLAHAAMYGLLALWAALGVPRERGWARLDARAVGAILALVFTYALVDEWHQSMTPGRTPSAWDVLTDLAGAGATLAVAAYAGRASARERGLWLRLAIGLAACLAAAALATIG